MILFYIFTLSINQLNTLIMEQLTYILPAIQLTIFAAFLFNVARLIINQLKTK